MADPASPPAPRPPTTTANAISPSSGGIAWWARVALAVAARPGLWATAVVQVLRLAPSGWWRRPPHLPLPDPSYLSFRLVTAYGGEGAPPRPGDVVTYLHWCRSWPHVTGS